MKKNTEYNWPAGLVEFYTEISNGCPMIDEFDLYKFEDWQYHSERIMEDFPFDTFYIWEGEEQDVDLSVIENGNIELIDIGDAQTWNIIVKGNQQGKMWSFSDVGIQPAEPQMEFLEWFEYWLDGNDYF